MLSSAKLLQQPRKSVHQVEVEGQSVSSMLCVELRSHAWYQRTLLKDMDLGPRGRQTGAPTASSVPALDKINLISYGQTCMCVVPPSYVPFDSGGSWAGGCSSVNSSPATSFTKREEGGTRTSELAQLSNFVYNALKAGQMVERSTQH